MKKLALAAALLATIAVAQTINPSIPESSVRVDSVNLSRLSDGGCAFSAYGSASFTDGGVFTGRTGDVQLTNATQRQRCLDVLNDVQAYYLTKLKGQ